MIPEGKDGTMLDLLKGMVPTNTELETGTVASVAGTCITYLCGWDDAMAALLVLMALDYITGVLAAIINPDMRPNSRRGFRGICKKVVVLAVVALGHSVSALVGTEAARDLVVCFFIGNEGLSILENAANAGVPVPEKLKGLLTQLKNEKESRAKDKESETK